MLGGVPGRMHHVEMNIADLDAIAVMQQTRVVRVCKCVLPVGAPFGGEV